MQFEKHRTKTSSLEIEHCMVKPEVIDFSQVYDENVSEFVTRGEYQWLKVAEITDVNI